MNAPSKSLVLFDIDGTLMRGVGRQHKLSLIEGIHQVTGRLTSLDGVPTAGMLDRDLIASMLVANGETESNVVAQLESIMLECQNNFVAASTSDLTAFLCRGVPDRLSLLHSAGAVLGLVTGNLSGIGWKKVELAKIKSFFSVGAFAEDGHTRAHLAAIAAQRAWNVGLLAPGCRISLIGDHANDVAAAKANGFQSVAVASGVMSFEELAAETPDILLHHLDELDVCRLL